MVYPSHYHHPEGEDVVLGEAHQWGVVVLLLQRFYGFDPAACER